MMITVEKDKDGNINKLIIRSEGEDDNRKLIYLLAFLNEFEGIEVFYV